MQGVVCPHCGEIIYSAFWQAGKEKCIYCHREFFIDEDQLKSADNPVQRVKEEK